MEGRAVVLRLDATDDLGGELAMRYGVRAVPTFVLLDGTGAPVLRQSGMPDRVQIVAAAEKLLEP